MRSTRALVGRDSAAAPDVARGRTAHVWPLVRSCLSLTSLDRDGFTIDPLPPPLTSAPVTLEGDVQTRSGVTSSVALKKEGRLWTAKTTRKTPPLLPRTRTAPGRRAASIAATTKAAFMGRVRTAPPTRDTSRSTIEGATLRSYACIPLILPRNGDAVPSYQLLVRVESRDAAADFPAGFGLIGYSNVVG